MVQFRNGYVNFNCAQIKKAHGLFKKHENFDFLRGEKSWSVNKISYYGSLMNTRLLRGFFEILIPGQPRRGKVRKRGLNRV